MIVENDTGISLLPCKKCESSVRLSFTSCFWVECKNCGDAPYDVAEKETVVRAWNYQQRDNKK